MRKTIAALSLLFISCTLWAGGDILWLMFPNWNSVNDLSQYLGRLELDGYQVLTEEDTQEELEAFAVQDLSLSLESLSPDEGIEVLDEMIIDFNFEDGGLTLLDFTMDAFNPDFWGQHLAEIEILMRDDLGWDPSMFRVHLIHMIERSMIEPRDVGQYIQIFVLYYLQLMQNHIDEAQCPRDYASYCTAVRRVVEYDLRRSETKTQVFYQRVCTAVSCFIEMLVQRIENPIISEAFRKYANGLIAAFFTNVCPNKRGRGCLDELPRGLVSLEEQTIDLVKIFRAIEVVLGGTVPCIDVLEAEYEALEGQEDEELLGELFLGIRRTQLAMYLSILYRIEVIIRAKQWEIEVLNHQFQARACELRLVEDSSFLLRIACGVEKKDLVRKKLGPVDSSSWDERKRDFNKGQRELNFKVLSKNRALVEHWRKSEALVCSFNGLGSDEETEVLTEFLSETSTVNLEDLEETFGIFEEEEDDQGPGRPSALKRQKVSNNEERESKAEEKEQKE